MIVVMKHMHFFIFLHLLLPLMVSSAHLSFDPSIFSPLLGYVVVLHLSFRYIEVFAKMSTNRIVEIVH